MVTYRVWQWLASSPARHPLFRRLIAPRAGTGLFHDLWRLVAQVAPLAYLGGVMLLCCAATSRSLGFLIVCVVLGLILFNGTLFAAAWAVAVAAALTHIRRTGEWELLCVVPDGASGAARAVATGVMHRQNRFRARHDRHLLALRLLLVLAFALSLGAVFDTRAVIHGDIAVIYTYFLVAVAASYADYVQSVALGALVGVFVGTRAAERLDAQALTLLLFLALQVAVYVVAVAGGLAVLPALLPAEMNGTAREVLLALLRLALFVGAREAVIALVARAVATRLSVSPAALGERRPHAA